MILVVENWELLAKEGMDMLTKGQEQVRDILLMPIESTTQESLNVFIYDGRIFSSQEYRGYDPDMSDFAVGFYQIIYRQILKKEYKILKGKMLKNEEFCGDTMNSYTIVTKNKINDKERKEWINKYHCLANFWLLPKHVGHSSSYTAKLKLMYYSKSKNGINDYMDNFLHNYLDKYEEYRAVFKDYTKRFTSKNFGDVHFLEGSYMEKGMVIDFSDEMEDKIIDIIWGKIKNRANLIACKKGEELYEYFLRLGIIDTK